MKKDIDFYKNIKILIFYLKELHNILQIALIAI